MATFANLSDTERTGLGGPFPLDVPRHNGAEATHRHRGHEGRLVIPVATLVEYIVNTRPK